MSGTPFPALPYWVPFYPYPSVLYGWTEYADVITKFSGIDRFKKRNWLQQPRATIQHVARFTEVGRYGQPKYCYEKAIYVVMISFALVSLSSSLTMGYRRHEFRLNKGYNVVSGHFCPYISCSKAWKHALFWFGSRSAEMTRNDKRLRQSK